MENQLRQGNKPPTNPTNNKFKATPHKDCVSETQIYF